MGYVTTALEWLHCGGATRGLPIHFKSQDSSLVQESCFKSRACSMLDWSFELVWSSEGVASPGQWP